jgi:hypothetical protein
VVNAKNITLNPDQIISNLGLGLNETRVIGEGVALQEKNSATDLKNRRRGVGSW